jgi:AraC-like DNA-binding protein
MDRDSTAGRIVVMAPDAVAAATVIDGGSSTHKKDGASLIAGHDTLLFVARGQGTYAINGQSGELRPNTLVTAPAGSFACTLDDDAELYVLGLRDAAVTPDDQRAFTPFMLRHLSPADGRRWHERMADAAARATAGRFTALDVTRIKNDALPYIWQRETRSVQTTLHALFETIWSRLTTSISLESLAAEAGYTANYLNDLTRTHTGRALGKWITDMRMARARVALEQTELPVAEVGAACGYDDPAYFSRVFRRAHGVPPQTWRIAARPVDTRYADLTISLEDIQEAERAHVSAQRGYSFASAS